MRLFVFSYNRGPFLANCIDSIERLAPDFPLTIVDDASDDPDTIAVLERAAQHHTVVTSAALSGHKHGGLYANMQSAFDTVPDATLFCFLQDDTQLVRPLTAGDEAALQQQFDHAPTLGFVSPAFIRQVSLKHVEDRDFRFDAALDLWFWHPQKRSTGAYYSDLLIARSDRLRAVGWRFESGESTNNQQAQMHFQRMGRLRVPFAMWLPNGPAFRGKQKSWALRFAERRRRCGLYPLQDLQPAAEARLNTTPEPALPIAEDCLQVRGPHRLPLPWTYDPMQGQRFLKLMDRLAAKRRQS
ncbi:MAG: glycosyltransferase [Algiphilus sp.]